MTTQLTVSLSELHAARVRVASLATGRLAIFDRDLQSLNADGSELHAILSRFLAADRRNEVRIVVHDAQPVRDRNPRLMRLLGTFGHCMTLRETPESLKHLADSLLIADTGHAVVQFHYTQARAKLVEGDEEAVRPYLQRFEDLWAEAGPAIGPGAVGL